jgi:hypothetical protein
MSHGAINLIGSWASILGVLITILGFLLALAKAARIAEVTQDILRRVRSRALEDRLNEARKTAELLDDSCRNDRLELAVDRALRLMTYLSELAGDSNVTSRRNAGVGTWKVQLKIAIEELETSYRNGEKASPETMGALRKIKIELDELGGHLKSEALDQT